MPVLPLACVEKLIRNAGAKRVSESATKTMVKVLEEIGNELAKNASELAVHAGRKTVVDEDILLAHKNWTE